MTYRLLEWCLRAKMIAWKSVNFESLTEHWVQTNTLLDGYAIVLFVRSNHSATNPQEPTPLPCDSSLSD